MTGKNETGKTEKTDRVLHHGRSSVRTRLVQPVVIKHGAVFALCTNTGDILPDSDQGLYFRDMRYLSANTLRLNGVEPVSLLADAGANGRAIFEMTNPDLMDEDGQVCVRKETLGIRRERAVGRENRQTITIRNFDRARAELTLTLRYAADFADMFAVRGVRQQERGRVHEPRWKGSTLHFRYDGADHHRRTLNLHFSQEPDERDGATLVYRIAIDGQETWELTIEGTLADRSQGAKSAVRPTHEKNDQLLNAREGPLRKGMQVETSNALFNQVLERSFDDLAMLSMREGGQTFFAAGVPWYVALFGRDSLVTAIEIAAYNPGVAAHTLRALAAHQGTKKDDWRDEQPGKILHELRVCEMANLGELPQTPYYGSCDSTPLFLILMGIYSSWAGTLDLFHELQDNVDAALDWIDDSGDVDGDGFFDYKTRSSRGLRNQGWKDSGNGIVMEDGSQAEPPIALPEVQGYVYLAWSMMADLFARDGDEARAKKLRKRAQDLYERFNQKFWLPDEGYYALCRQADGRFSQSIASNGAHTLWTGIIPPDRALSAAQRVLQDDMFSGWGVRTLSSKDRSYNPVDYQVGSIWPQDNALIVLGMQRYGLMTEALQIVDAIVAAASVFEHYRLPETFAGYPRAEASKPVLYPVACNPQAWAAGAIPLMLQAALGLRPDAFEHRLCVQHPSLPTGLDWVMVRGLRVGECAVDLRYERAGAGSTLAAVLHKDGPVDVSIVY